MKLYCVLIFMITIYFPFIIFAIFSQLFRQIMLFIMIKNMEFLEVVLR